MRGALVKLDTTGISIQQKVRLSIWLIESPKLVGTPRFELGASPTPRVRATRLRHVPLNWPLVSPQKTRNANCQLLAVVDQTVRLRHLRSLSS
jgi:hypothetical protein